MGEGNTSLTFLEVIHMIKLLIGGSPCTFWSIAQKNGRETEASGMGWELFKNFLIAKDKFKPDFFLYENNKSAAQPIKDQISKELGVDLMYINSALVSAQNRQRFYAFNWEVEQPEDRGIVLRDILESSTTEYGYQLESIKCLSEREMDYAEPIYVGEVPGHKGVYRNGKQPSQQYRVYSAEGKSVACDQDSRKFVAEPIRIGDIGSTAQAHRVYSCDGKSVTINANGGGQGGKTGLYATPIDKIDFLGSLYSQHSRWGVFGVDGKSPTITASAGMGGGHLPMYPVKTDEIGNCDKNPTTKKQIYEVKDGLITIRDKQYPIKLKDGYYIIRKLTPVECERLQTLPDGYTKAVSNTQRYKGLGNGWTAEVIIHILNGALKDVPRDEEIVVLSMYDGIGTGRYCLDKMGFTNVKYFAYEIDKYAKQVALDNYPDIIHMGDAFDLRHPDWTIGY